MALLQYLGPHIRGLPHSRNAAPHSPLKQVAAGELRGHTIATTAPDIITTPSLFHSNVSCDYVFLDC